MTRLGPLVFAGALVLGTPAALHAQSSRTVAANSDRELKAVAAVPASAARGGQVVGLLLLALLAATAVGVLFYFVPTAVAVLRWHPKTGPIVVVNLLLGWTFVGWGVALAWALSPREPESDHRDEH